MVDFDYLSKGLCALARAHRANTMAGHLGAAVVAGYFFGEEHHELDERVVAARNVQAVRGADRFGRPHRERELTTPVRFENPVPDSRYKQWLNNEL